MLKCKIILYVTCNYCFGDYKESIVDKIMTDKPQIRELNIAKVTVYCKMYKLLWLVFHEVKLLEYRVYLKIGQLIRKGSNIYLFLIGVDSITRFSKETN